MENVEFNFDFFDDEYGLEREFKYELSIGMIVKNEEEGLEECLKALSRLRDEVNCELIITDTGSTDRTVEIAEKYADKVLHFEWCNDFSKARNTGVEAAEGKWFMFLDADEVFDRSIMELVKFLKLPNRDDYDNATYIVRSYMDDERKRYNDFRAGRMFNFTKKKRYFVFTIHEAIPAEGERYQLDGVAWHSGYHEGVFGDKRVRNREILEKELAEDPNNIRFMKQIIDISTDEDEKIELANKAIELCKNKEATNTEIIFSIYIFLGRTYLNKKDFEKVVEISEDFLRIRMKDNRNLPYLEMSWISAVASLELGKTIDALRKFEFYKGCYEYLLKNPDNIFCSSGVYGSNKEVIYHKVCLQVVECLKKIGEVNRACRQMDALNCYKFKEYGEYPLINNYIKTAIMLSQPEFFNRALVFIQLKRLDIYLESKYAMVMLGKMYFTNSIEDFTQSCDKTDFSKMWLQLFKGYDESLGIVCQHLSRKIKFSNLKEHEYYLDIMRLYMLFGTDYLRVNSPKIQVKEMADVQSKIMSSLTSSGLFANDNNVKSNTVDKTQIMTDRVNKVFEIFIKNNYDYINKTDGISKLKEKDFKEIEPAKAMTIIVYDGLKNKDSDINEYIESLKKSMPYSGRHINSVKLAINLAQKSL